MERAKQIITELRAKAPPPTEQMLLNTLREYLQTVALKLIFQSKHGPALSFMGGTALRICHDIKRYSEDLDFALDDAGVTAYDFSLLMGQMKREFALRGFAIESTAHADKTVQKGFLRFAGLREAFGLKHWPTGQKMHIKIEVDVKPVHLRPGERESFFVTRFKEIFPILKHGLPTLFAGKLLALFNRPYERGRDYYDLIWYLAQKTALNIGYLNRGLGKEIYRDEREVFARLGKKIHAADMSRIMRDMDKFLEDPTEADWLKRYDEIFEQLMGRRCPAK